jgi:hypothetical protein
MISAASASMWNALRIAQPGAKIAGYGTLLRGAQIPWSFPSRR